MEAPWKQPHPPVGSIKKQTAAHSALSEGRQLTSPAPGEGSTQNPWLDPCPDVSPERHRQPQMAAPSVSGQDSSSSSHCPRHMPFPLRPPCFSGTRTPCPHTHTPASPGPFLSSEVFRKSPLLCSVITSDHYRQRGRFRESNQ